MSSEEIGDQLMTVWRLWKSASPVGRGAITQEQYWVLKSLRDAGPMMLKDLAGKIGCTPGSASVAVKRLEKAGLLTRERSQSDERVVTVTLSRKGAESLASWKSDQLRSMAGIFDSLDQGEKNALRGLIGKALSSSGAVPAPRTRNWGKAR